MIEKRNDYIIEIDDVICLCHIYINIFNSITKREILITFRFFFFFFQQNNFILTIIA
jgi:hypothetical protein